MYIGNICALDTHGAEIFSSLQIIRTRNVLRIAMEMDNERFSLFAFAMNARAHACKTHPQHTNTPKATNLIPLG